MPKSTRTIIALCYNERTQVEPGVWENGISKKIVKASVSRIFQRRVDQALADGMPLTYRFQVRAHHVKRTPDYVEYEGESYKIRTCMTDPSKHIATIETREQL